MLEDVDDFFAPVWGVGRRFDCLSRVRVLPVGGEAVVVLGRHVDDELL